MNALDLTRETFDLVFRFVALPITASVAGAALVREIKGLFQDMRDETLDVLMERSEHVGDGL